MTTRSILGVDVGGANLKAAHPSGFTRHVGFPLWKDPGGLAEALRGLFAGAPPHDVLAVTMTGELCDCFESKRQGVFAILDALQKATSVPLRVWTTKGTFLDVAQARAQPLVVASANWLALATFAGRFASAGPAILIDIGTTTTDIVPLVNGKPVPRGRTDPDRLRNCELVYRGWRRTPLCVHMGDGAAELFATTLDIYLVMGMVPENPGDCDTADGKPATRAAAHRRLARMMCADLETSTPKEREELATILNLRVVTNLAMSVSVVLEKLPSPCRTVIASGSGEFLIPMIFRCPTAPELTDVIGISLAQQLGKDVSAAACAHAVAVLCAEQEG
jgi:probable H4MPT-linked C1 transfer pathway protein